MLKSLDQYRMEYKLTFDNKEKFQNTAGGLFTIFTYFIALAMIFNFGQEIWVKQNPNVVP